MADIADIVREAQDVAIMARAMRANNQGAVDVYLAGRMLALIEKQAGALQRSSERDALVKALEWYASEAEAAARYMAQGKMTTADALLAILTVLANDGGRRAREAITGAVGGVKDL